jgi:hypothetical protein
MRALCNKVKARGAPTAAVRSRDIAKRVCAFAILRGDKVDNPAADVGAASSATFVPQRSRAVDAGDRVDGAATAMNGLVRCPTSHALGRHAVSRQAASQARLTSWFLTKPIRWFFAAKL